MSGRNRRNRGTNRNDFLNQRSRNSSPSNKPRASHTSGPTTRGGHRRHSNAPAHTTHAGVHRFNDNSNPSLSARLRKLKYQSEVVLRIVKHQNEVVQGEINTLVGQIDELQPEKDGMDWTGSAGTIVYVPVPRAADGSFHHVQMRSISPGEYPNTAAGFVSVSQPIHAEASTTKHINAPDFFPASAESTREQPSRDTDHQPAATESSHSSRSEIGRVTGKDAVKMHHALAHTSNPQTNTSRTSQAQATRSEAGVEGLRMQAGDMGPMRKEAGNASTAIETLVYREGIAHGIRGRSNASPATVTNLVTPPPSPVGRVRHARWESYEM